MGSKKDLADVLETVGLFSRCTARERRAVARHAQTASLPAGTDLVVEGEPGDALFVIIDGKASVRRAGIEVNQVSSNPSRQPDPLVIAYLAIDHEPCFS